MPAPRWHLPAALLAVAALVALDQGIKAWVVHACPLGVPHPVLGGFLFLTHQQNTGVAFSMLDTAPRALVPLLTVVILVAFALLARQYLRQGPGLVAGTLVLAGALGNLIDRVSRGFVVDYIDVHYGWFRYSVFNLADTLVVVGIGLLILTIIRSDLAAQSRSGGPT